MGRIILHDLAGQAEYYSSHTAVLENLLQGTPAVFILVVSLADEMFQESFQFWLTAIENVSHRAFKQCHLFSVASHADQSAEKGVDKIDTLKAILSNHLPSSSEVIAHHNDIVKLDCRKLGGSKLDLLILSLSKACKSISTSNNIMSIYCHILYDFFQRDRAKCYYSLDSLLEIFKEQSDLFLPSNIDRLLNIIYNLSSTGLIVFLRNEKCLEKSWIVIDKSILLSDLDGILFAPDDFKQHVNIANNTGIIKVSDLKALFPNYDSELLVHFLQYMELCQIIAKEFINAKSLSNGNPDSDEYLFVPALIKDTQKPEIQEAFMFGWCLRCENPHHFPSRFLHLLLLHLAYKFSIRKSSDSNFERLCKIWTSGIYWKNTKGVQTLVELVDNNQSLCVLMSCERGYIRHMITLIKKVIIEVLTCKQQVMPKTKCHEFLIDNEQLHYPLESTACLYNIELLAKCCINRDEFIIDAKGEKQIQLSKLLKEHLWIVSVKQCLLDVD